MSESGSLEDTVSRVQCVRYIVQGTVCKVQWLRYSVQGKVGKVQF